MKVSKYNIYVEKEGRKFVYNQLRSSLLEIDEELFRRLSVPDSEVDSVKKGVKICLELLTEEKYKYKFF